MSKTYKVISEGNFGRFRIAIARPEEGKIRARESQTRRASTDVVPRPVHSLGM